MGIHLSADSNRSRESLPTFHFHPLASPRGTLLRLAVLLLGVSLFSFGIIASTHAETTLATLTEGDTVLLDEVQRRAVLFFTEQSDPVTGLTRDRAPKDGHPGTAPASIAATGFALTAWCIADAHGWVAPGEALARVRTTLRFVAGHTEHERGWFYHFIDGRTGRRAWRCEASTIDTALFLKGALAAREYLQDPETTDLVNRIYGRIDWQWALNGGQTLTHGWRPESGFIPHRWDSYSELMGMYLLGIGAPSHGLPVASWDAWSRGPRVAFEGREFLQGGPLFTHQYAQAWFDFRGRRDAYADYWQNSVDATLAQRAWSARQSSRYSHWSDEMWGLTASDSARGYKAWGTPGHENESADGTLVPCAPGGSLPFAPRECLTALAHMRDAGGPAVWGRYGFADAFNPQTGWASPDVIGIDVGITLIMAENLRSGLIWNVFMRAPEVRHAMQLAGFQSKNSSSG
ncbi:MAG TPA: glucoamylase family protein [Lacunisphaera sp.]|nr:glucoamylase family protein [Lacunisphaera sp.]